jgi:hypothetical protein
MTQARWMREPGSRHSTVLAQRGNDLRPRS